MLGETYKKLGEFQSILKKCILDRFKENLSQDKIDLLNSTNYIIESELVNFRTGNEIQGKILRNMLLSIIDINCTKQFTLPDNTTITIPYGDDIEEEVIEFYATNIADKYKFGIDSKKTKLTLAYSLMDALGTSFDSVMLNNKADTILEMDILKMFAMSYDKDILRPYATASIVDVSDPVTHLDPTIKNEDVNILELADPSIEIISLEGSEPVQEESLEPIKEEKQSILSEEQYKELCMKYARNEALTAQELNMLLMSTPDLVDPNDPTALEKQSVDLIDSTMTDDIKSRGYTSGSLSTYIIIVFTILLLVLGIIIF